MEPYIPWIKVAVGFLLLYCGWALYRAGLMMVCFFLGALGGGCMAQVIIHTMPTAPDTWWFEALWMFVGAIAGVFILRRLYIFGVFIVAGLFALNAKQTILKDPWIFHYFKLTQFQEYWTSPVGTVVFAVVVGLLVIALHRFVIVFLTSGAGAILVADLLPLSGAVYLLFIAGVIVQFGLMRKFGIDTGRETVRWKQERVQGQTVVRQDS